MSAIFIVIFIEQWKNKNLRTPALVGLIISLICLLIFGVEGFLLPALVGICIVLSFLKQETNA